MNTAQKLNEIASKLDGIEVGQENTVFTKDEWVEMAKEGIVITFGYSDDLLELRGAIHDELGSNLGEKYMWFRGSIVAEGTIEEVNEIMEEHNLNQFEFKPSLFAEWRPKKDGNEYASWHIKVSAPHAEFWTMDYGELFCIGCVFYLKDIKGGRKD